MNRLLGHPGGLLGVYKVYLSVPCECQASPLLGFASCFEEIDTGPAVFST